MLLRFDPFRDLDRLTNEMLSASRVPQAMPMDCYRSGHTFHLLFDLPGMDADSLQVTAENNSLTISAERRPTAPGDAVFLVNERPTGTYSRQLVLGDGLDVDAIDADYRDGVLTLTIPVAAEAKPRRIEIARSQSAVKGQDRTPIEGQLGDTERQDTERKDADRQDSDATVAANGDRQDTDGRRADASV